MAKTDRGFEIAEFKDRYDTKCSLQESSLATEAAIWLGVDDADPQIMATDAIKLGIPTCRTTGWVPYPIPKEVLLSTRMHLTQDDVLNLLPALIYFVEHGHLPDSSDKTIKILDELSKSIGIDSE